MNKSRFDIFAYLFLGAAILVFIFVFFADKGDKDSPVTVSSPRPSESSAVHQDITESKAPVAPKYTLNQDVIAGDFMYNIKSVTVNSEIDGTTTEDQFVIIQLAIKNNDDTARDIASLAFKLVDSAGKEYEAASIYSSDFLFYETINPGLTRTRSIAFETPKGVSGLKITADSGVAFASGETVTIGLGL